MPGLLSQIGHWIFPQTCELCGDGPLEEGYVCPSCLSNFTKPERPLCFRCGEPVHGAVSVADECPHCDGHEHHYDFARACFLNKGDVRNLVLKLKYSRRIYFGRSLGRMLAGLWEEYEDVLAGRDWLLVPVPIHAGRLRQRGYNQAEELANALAGIKKLKVRHALRRKRDTRSQTSLNREERFNHVRRLYEIKPSCLKNGVLDNADVLLIDDVLTTGSTAEACARELKKAGAATVGVLSVLRSCMVHTNKRT